ncbi:MAG: glycosyltransferase family 4 protein [Granulosicoccaceae bacterium]
MRFACVMFKYFPYGGLQRDFMRMARQIMARGDSVDVYTLEWQGEVPLGMQVHIIEARALTNHGKYEKFYEALQQRLAAQHYDCVIGYNKLPGLDVYYAADPCYEARVRRLRSKWYRLTRRYKHFAGYECAVFAPHSDTEILLIAEAERDNFMRYYHTPAQRLHMLPPGIQRDRLRGDDYARQRADFRREFGLADDERLVLMVGSGFRTKGLDRTLAALAALPAPLRQRTRLIVIGKDNIKPFVRMATKLGINDRMQFFAGRDDIPRFLFGADLLIHPAYSENTGTVLLEALAAGLAVLTTDVCGYAHYITEAHGGKVLSSPFSQAALNTALSELLSDDAHRAELAEHGHAWAAQADIYDLHTHAVEIIYTVARRRAGGSA